eukprot:3938337-Rhodomonas_salina.1
MPLPGAGELHCADFPECERHDAGGKKRGGDGSAREVAFLSSSSAFAQLCAALTADERLSSALRGCQQLRHLNLSYNRLQAGTAVRRVRYSHGVWSFAFPYAFLMQCLVFTSIMMSGPDISAWAMLFAVPGPSTAHDATHSL